MIPRSSLSMRHIALMLLISACWLLGSTEQLEKNLHGATLPVTILFAGAVICVVLVTMPMWAPIIERQRWKPLLTLWIGMLALYAILHPMAEHRVLEGLGSDSEDALRIAAAELAAAHYPYYARTYLGGPITPLPGAVLLAMPFYYLNKVGLQNVVWLGLFMVAVRSLYASSATAIAYLLVVACGELGSLDQFAVGGDYVTNLWYVIVACLCFIRSQSDGKSYVRLLCGVLLGLSMSSRPIYPLVFLPLLIAYLKQEQGVRRTIIALSIPTIVMTAVTLPFYLYDASSFSPLHIQHKLDFLSPRAAGFALYVLPIAGLGVACSGFFIRLSLPRLLLLAGMALLIIIGIPGTLAVVRDPQRESWKLLGYADVAAMLIATWAFHELEQARPKNPRAHDVDAASRGAQ